MARKDETMSMEKERSRKVAIGEARESTRSRDWQSPEETHKLSISIQKKVTHGDECSLDEKFQMLRESYKRSIKRPLMAKIQKVPFPFRGHKYFKKYFEPRAVALGPIHHGKPGLELAEEYKPRLAGYFIQESGCDGEKIYNAVKEDIKNLRACYEDEVTKCYDDEELAWMLFLDGSSLIGFITCIVEEKLDEMNVKNDLAAFGQQDAFLLENQLPWRLLKLLIDQSSENKDKWNKNILVFIDKVRKHTITLKKSRSQGSVGRNQTESISNDCPHLLHQLRKTLLGDEGTQKVIDNLPSGGSSSSNAAQRKPTSSSSECRNNLNNDVEANGPDDSKCCKPVAVTAGFFRCPCNKEQRQPSSSSSESRNNLNDDVEANGPDDSKCCKPVAVTAGFFRCPCKRDDNLDDKPTTFRNIKELKSAGIRVRGDNSRCLTQIYFRSRAFFPTLYMPSLVVDDWTAPKFLNLVAYEMCPDFHNDFGITSYVCFLDSLIDQPEDVKYLRDADILYNVLGSDEEVATLFNEISTDLVPNENTYSDAKKKIQRHYDKAWTEWVALGYYKHCSNPWTLLALLGALLALALSFIQTWKALDDSCTKICHA